MYFPSDFPQTICYIFFSSLACGAPNLTAQTTINWCAMSQLLGSMTSCNWRSCLGVPEVKTQGRCCRLHLAPHTWSFSHHKNLCPKSTLPLLSLQQPCSNSGRVFPLLLQHLKSPCTPIASPWGFSVNTGTLTTLGCCIFLICSCINLYY